ncbi:hypothetical protein GBAR_LOCUS18293 [Geodia barretti]|uniref:Uncharacterized protein n=1 Tax=Geodia barretti TaxID=519541 RepID=A0AA35SP74_GEOBA|nr:hypothetical protein GBAR_LOCUS18293 [Geodia barretti]
MTISGSGSGGNSPSQVDCTTDFVRANCTNEVRLPSEKALSVLFGAVASAVVVLAVVLVVVTIVCQRRRRGTKAYYSVTIQPRDSDTRESIRSNAPVLDLRQDQLGRSVEGGESVAMVETVTQSACTEPPSEKSALVTAEGFKKDCLSVAASKSQFSFEDGTSLHDYPASVDLEVSGRDEGEPARANIMGYCDIYSSQILALPTEDTTPVKRDQSLRPAPSSHSSGRRLKRHLPAATATPTPHITRKSQVWYHKDWLLRDPGVTQIYLGQNLSPHHCLLT